MKRGDIQLQSAEGGQQALVMAGDAGQRREGVDKGMAQQMRGARDRETVWT